MSRLIRAAGLAVLLAVAFAAGRVFAAGNGQDDLDKAEEAKLDRHDDGRPRRSHPPGRKCVEERA